MTTATIDLVGVFATTLPKIVPKVGQVIRSLDFAQCKAAAKEALGMSGSAAIMDLTLSIARERYPELLD